LSIDAVHKNPPLVVRRSIMFLKQKALCQSLNANSKHFLTILRRIL